MISPFSSQYYSYPSIQVVRPAESASLDPRPPQETSLTTDSLDAKRSQELGPKECKT